MVSIQPQLAVRRQSAEADEWMPVFAALNLALVKEFAQPMFYDALRRDRWLSGAVRFAQSKRNRRGRAHDGATSGKSGKAKTAGASEAEPLILPLAVRNPLSRKLGMRQLQLSNCWQ